MTDNNSSDILVEISPLELPELLKLYEVKATFAPYVCGLIRTAICMKQSTDYANKIRILSPHKKWKEDGTIITVVKFGTITELFLFTLEEFCSNLRDGLFLTQQILYPPNQILRFFWVHEKHVSLVEEYQDFKNLKRLHTIPCFTYKLPLETSLELKYSCPDDVYVRKLDASAAEKINSVWPLRRPGSETQIRDIISLNGGYGVFLKDNDELVAWVIRHYFNQLAMLQTDKDHQRKGYSKILVKALAQEIGKLGNCPVATVVVGNEASKKLFEDIGFYSIGQAMFYNVMT